MKIAMLGHKRIPSREGGVEIVVEELATAMATRGHEVTVYNRKGHHVSDRSKNIQVKKQKWDYKGVRIITVPTFEKKSLNAVVYAFFAMCRAAVGRYDVIHVHAEGSCSMIPIAKLFGKRVVATIHGLDWQRSKWGGFATKFLLFGEKMAVKYADEIIVLSKGVQNYFLDTYARKTRVIPNGIREPEIVPAEIITKKYGLQSGDYILFLARLVPEKGVHYLLEAYKKLDTDIRLVIAGGSSHSDGYMKEIQDMASKDERVIMTGFVEGRELEELYSNCLLYVLPSDIEGMPISLLEAMSYGCHCLVSDIAENMEVVGDMAMCFQKGESDDLKRKLEDFLRTSEAGQWKGTATEEKCEFLRQQIRKYIVSRYNWEDVVEQTLQLYR